MKFDTIFRKTKLGSSEVHLSWNSDCHTLIKSLHEFVTLIVTLLDRFGSDSLHIIFTLCHQTNTVSVKILSVHVGRVVQSVQRLNYWLDGPGSKPGGDEIFRPSSPTLGPTQPPVTWVPVLSRG